MSSALLSCHVAISELAVRQTDVLLARQRQKPNSTKYCQSLNDDSV